MSLQGALLNYLPSDAASTALSEVEPIGARGFSAAKCRLGLDSWRALARLRAEAFAAAGAARVEMHGDSDANPMLFFEV